MKKIFPVLAIVMMTFSPAFSSSTTWSTALGNASFATDSTWTISDGRITQIWSDVVQTDMCSNKATFNGNDLRTSTFRVDCRSNPTRKGDLFSWQAVYELGRELCPHPWRVPTKQDFLNLDIALGGNGRERWQETVNGHSWEQQLAWYTGRWGGDVGGLCNQHGTVLGVGFWGEYWSQTAASDDFGISLFFEIGGTINPQNWNLKDHGLRLRCVR
ncbi:MAG: fibrobacter succinogenes major paralogous domain-containing protein [Bacteroidales bacterium]|nr:fibrobacter succinogenes major paralogous domain-containing protein [Bacteroidales bacterium]